MTTEPDDYNCPHCGMAIVDGDMPTEQGGRTYCCPACALGNECTCSRHQHGAGAREAS